jgi:hypothetical protein
MIGENAFDFIFINRDSEYSSVFRDLMKSYEKLKTNGLILCYHSDHHTTQSAIEDFLGVVFAVDCGEFGDKMRLFRKGEL